MVWVSDVWARVVSVNDDVAAKVAAALDVVAVAANADVVVPC